MKKHSLKLLLLLIFMFLYVACSAATASPTATATAVPPCTEAGQELLDKVPETDISFNVYLPPCYDRDTAVRYPLLVWAAGQNLVGEQADALMQAGEIRPFIIVMPFSPGGLDYEQRLVEELLPYVEATYRTLPERPYRAVAGISHGAAIAARSVWRYPDLYGAGLSLSGGIDASEADKFTDWITAVAPENYPHLLIDVGEDDSIIPLTEDYLAVLNAESVPYTFTSAPGGHNSQYWGAMMPDYLRWLNTTWPDTE